MVKKKNQLPSLHAAWATHGKHCPVQEATSRVAAPEDEEEQIMLKTLALGLILIQDVRQPQVVTKTAQAELVCKWDYTTGLLVMSETPSSATPSFQSSPQLLSA